jgi:hypothetical protein
MNSRVWLVAAMLLALSLSSTTASTSWAAGPVDPYIPKTLVELVEFCDFVLLVRTSELVKPSAKKADDDDSADKSAAEKPVLRMHVVRIAKQPDEKRYAVGTRIDLEVRGDYPVGRLFLMTGLSEHDGSIDWYAPEPFAAVDFDYLLAAPSSERPDVERVAHFLKFFDNPSATIAKDACIELRSVSMSTLFASSRSLKPSRLRPLLASESSTYSQRELAGIMLGGCGDDSDADRLRDLALGDLGKNRAGRLGAMIGLVRLEGPQGLDQIDRAVLSNPRVSFRVLYEGIQAVRTIRDSTPRRVSLQRCIESLRQVLGHPEYCDLVIGDLVRAGDWSVLERVKRIYNQAEGKDVDVIRMAMIKYILAAADDLSQGPKAPHVSAAKRHLDACRRLTPKLVERIEGRRADK